MRLFLLFFVLIICKTGAQSIEGGVYDAEKNIPLKNVNVYFKRYNIGTATDVEGKFKLKKIKKYSLNDTLTFSYIGYNPRKITISFFKSNNYSIKLFKKTEILEEIVVSRNKKLNKYIKYEDLTLLKKGVYFPASTLVEDYFYIIGGDLSYEQNGVKRTLKEVGGDPKSTFNDFIKKMRTNYNWQSYSGDLQIYDINNDKWELVKNKFIKRANHKAVLIKGKIYSLGGKKKSLNRKKELLEDKIEVIDIFNDKITTLNSNPHHAVNLEVIKYDKFIITMGGAINENNGNKIYTDKMHIYNTEKNKWYFFWKNA